MSKRLNFSVDIDDDALFDKSVKEAFEAYARQTARSEIEKSYEQLIKDEARRVTNRIFEKDYWQREPQIKAIVRSIINQRVLEIINTDEIIEAIKEIAKDRCDGIITSQFMNRVDAEARSAAQLVVKDMFKNFGA